MKQEQAKKGLVERGAGFFKRIHYALGAVALGAGLAFESSVATIVGIYELGHGFVLGAIEKWAAKQKQTGKVIPKAA